MNDQTIISIAGLISTIFTGIMAYFMLRLKQKADKAEVKVEQVAEKLVLTEQATDAKLKDIAVVVDATHKLSNSKMGIALRTAKDLTRRLAEISKDPKDIASADQAEAQYNEHQRQQEKVDAVFPDGIPPASKTGESVVKIPTPAFTPEQMVELSRMFKKEKAW